jgi:serine/threonine protein kinase
MAGLADIDKAAAAVCKQRNFSLEGGLGSGAQKRAYLISSAGKRFALKIGPISPSIKPRFEREAEVQASCSHEAIAKLFDAQADTIDGQEYWISVEEYLPGGTLAERLVRGGVPAAVAVRDVGLRLAGALAHLEERNFVHRDIKPANILFRQGNEAVLTDFGIVRMLDAATLTHAHIPQGPGTPLYAAPEQLHNEQSLIDWRTDQFGLALVVGEAVLGHHPFSPERDPNLALGRMSNREQLPAQSAGVLIGTRLDALVKALAPWPVQRFRRPLEFIEGLKRY